MKLELLQKLRNYYKRKKAEAIQYIIKEEKEKRERLFKYMFEDLSLDFIEYFNNSLLIESSGWLGGDYNQADIRRCLLRDFDGELTEEECAFLRRVVQKGLLEEDVKNKRIDLDTFNKKIEELGDISKEAFMKLSPPDEVVLARRKYFI